MTQPNGPDLDRLLQLLGLVALLFYLAPAVFSQLAPASSVWLRRASVATLAVGGLIAIAASLRWALW